MMIWNSAHGQINIDDMDTEYIKNCLNQFSGYKKRTGAEFGKKLIYMISVLSERGIYYADGKYIPKELYHSKIGQILFD